MKTSVPTFLWIWVVCLPVSFSFLYIAKREEPANRGRKEQTVIVRRVSLSKEPFGSSNDVSPPPPIPITATFSLPSSSSSSSSLKPPKILFESDRLLVIDKPYGISHHNDRRGGDSSSATTKKEDEVVVEEEEEKEEMGILSVMRQCQREGSIGYQGRLYGVHRLDRVTSGILLLAKDPEMASILTARFRSNQIIKYYCGISSKKPTKKKQGWIQGNMVRGRRKSWYLTREGRRRKERSAKSSSSTTVAAATDAPLSMSTTKKSQEKPQRAMNYAKTRFFTASLLSIKDQVSSSWKDDDDVEEDKDDDAETAMMIPRTLLLFRPYTGKTHQLRVAAKSVGLPLLGDPVYSSNSNNNNKRTNKGLRTFLHAAAIHIPDVLEKDGALTLWSPPPFHHLWDNHSDGAATSQFDTIVAKTIEKHCDCPEIRSIVLQ